jgi:uracil-DNA glycosylase
MSAKSLDQHFELLSLSGIDEIFIDSESEITTVPDLEKIKLEYTNCRKCSLAENRIKFVYGEGSQSAKLMLIGEAPGAEENISGKPFVGRAGQLLTKMLKAINIEREEVYITNVVKCRPPNNRNPLPEEIAACSEYLDEQLAVIQPELILLLGRVASEALLKQNITLGEYRKQTHIFKGIKTYVTYHPSALLRNPGWKKFAWIDLQKLRDDYNQL